MKLVRHKQKEVATSALVNKIVSLVRANGMKIVSTQTWQPSTFAPYTSVNIALTAFIDDSGSRYITSEILDALAVVKRMHKNFLYSIYFNPKTPRLITLHIQEFEDVMGMKGESTVTRPVTAKVNPLKRVEKLLR